MSFSTQIVTTRGIQISRPVMKYFFTGYKQKSPARAGPLVLGAPSVGGRGRFLGFGLRFRLGFGLGLGLCVGLLLGRLLAAALEVGRVPAAALQLKPGRAELLLIGLLAARGTFGERLFGN